MKHFRNVANSRPTFGRVVSLMVLSLSLAVGAESARAAQPGAPAAPPSAHARAPYDPTGYWVSVITQDWRYRMVLPGKGEYGGIPLNLAAKQYADAWSPGPDEAAGQACKAYGAGALLRIPGRLHITWQDDDTLKVQTDAGQQTRLLRFNAPAADAVPPPSLQGLSVASWIVPAPPRGPAPAPAAKAAGPPPFGTLKVVTTDMLPGYLRKNGVPYSDQMTMVEYWDLRRASDGSQWLTITTELKDPRYLQAPYVFVPTFKKEADGSRWDPSACSLRW